MSSLIRYQAVTVDDVLGFLSSRTCTPSSMGQQLERARVEYVDVAEHSSTANPMHVKKPLQDVTKAQDRAENEVLSKVGVQRCVDTLARVQHVHVVRNRAKGLSRSLPALEKLHRLTPARSQGELVVQCLRVYEERRGVRSPEEALASVYQWAHGHAPETYPVVLHDEADLPQAFRLGKAVRARQKAAEIYADCFLVLAEFVAAWNRRQVRAA